MEPAYIPIAVWWDRVDERDHEAVLAHIQQSRGFAGVPWAFLPPDLKAILQRRVRVDARTARFRPFHEG